MKVNADFPSGFKTNIFGEYIANTPYLFVFLPKGKRHVFGGLPRFFLFFDQLVEFISYFYIFSHTCELIKITYSHALYIVNHDSFIIFCRECFFLFVHYCFYLMIFRSYQILFYNFIFIGN